MPRLLSGSTLRRGGSGEFIDLKGAMPQLPETPTTSTGYTLVTDNKLRTSYRSSLGNIEINFGEMYSNLPNQNIKLIGTGTSFVVVSGGIANTSTNTGALVIEGGVGIRDSLHAGKDIVVNGLIIGRGFEGKNNIVFKGEASSELFGDNSGENVIAIGYDSLIGISSAYKSIAMGRYALSTGTKLSRSIAIGDSALKEIGTKEYVFAATITNIVLSTPVEVTAPDHGLTSGTSIRLLDIQGTVELNNNLYYAWVVNSSTFNLYYDLILNQPVTGTTFTAYDSSGTVEVNTVYDDNIAIGVDAGRRLINGRQNFFLGDEIAINLTTGSYNILIGHEVANNLRIGNGNISIGGDNLVNGWDNQVNIGSVFYFDGRGYSQINSNLGVGIGTTAVGTLFHDKIVDITTSNPVVIQTEVLGLSTGTRIYIDSVIGTTELNGKIYFASYAGTGTSSTHFASLYYDYDLTQPVDGTSFTTYISSGTVYTIEPTGSISVIGGVGINGNLVVSDQADFYSGMTVQNLITGTVTTAINLKDGNTGSIPYQVTSGETRFIDIGASGSILTSNGTTATWQPISSIAIDVSSSTNKLLVSTATSPAVYYPTLSTAIGGYQDIDADSSLSYVATATSTSSYWTSGTNILNVPGSVYSQEGNDLENNLLYSPRVTVSATAPSNPRVGDFWIDSVNGVELQWIDDGGNRFWIQFTGL